MITTLRPTRACSYELARSLVLYDVYVHHNTPHEGLLGETPRAAWQRLMLQGAGFSRVTPGAHQQRAIFGIPLTRTLSKRGIRVLRTRNLAVRAHPSLPGAWHRPAAGR